jgi:flagellar biosynthesis GTPase FlhF
MSVITILPRTAVRAGLAFGRAPLTIAEAVRGDGDPAWPPALAYDDFAAGVRRTVGALLGDDSLVRAGELQRARIAELRRAAELEADATERREQADAQLHERRRRANRHRDEVRREARAEESSAQAATRRRREQARTTEQTRKRAARATQTAAEERLDKQTRAARAARLEAETEALDDERAAVTASRVALDADTEIERSRAARRAGR